MAGKDISVEITVVYSFQVAHSSSVIWKLLLMIKLHIPGCTNLYLLLFDSIIMNLEEE